MSTVNKQSIREEAERIKLEFNQLFLNGEINQKSKLLFHSMLMLINLLISIFLERTTAKNNKNSSKPSSQTEKDQSFTTNSSTNSKGKLESKVKADNSRTVENTTTVKVTNCDICGQDLSSLACQGHERRTKIDIIFEKVIEHVDAEIKYCSNCEVTVKGKFPAELSGPLQYGNGLKAYVINLLISQMMSLNRIQKLINAMIGTIIAEASILKFVLRLYQALEGWESNTTKQILKNLVINVDETSLRVDKKNHWIHAYSSGELVLKFLHKKRGTEAINAINIIPSYSGIIIHDCWASYLTYNNCEHGLCGSHLVRELTYVVESNGYNWAKNLKKLLLKTCKQVSKHKDKKLGNQKYAKLQQHYRSILTRGAKELPAIPVKPNYKRGCIAKSDAHNLWERLKEYESAVLLFAKKSEVPFTNNRAEQDIRMAKVKQKVSGCFRSEVYAKAYCRISSYLQTMANKGYNPLNAIQIALANENC